MLEGGPRERFVGLAAAAWKRSPAAFSSGARALGSLFCSLDSCNSLDLPTNHLGLHTLQLRFTGYQGASVRSLPALGVAQFAIPAPGRGGPTGSVRPMPPRL